MPDSSGSSDEQTQSADIASIKQREEQRYQVLLAELNQRDPVAEANAAISRGDLRMLAYQAGRGGITLPGFPGETAGCGVILLDGMGDVIFGKQHLQYRVALRRFATQYNQLVYPHCKR